MAITDIDFKVTRLTRVEGHGNILVRTAGGKLREVRLEVTESPRFFERILVGRSWQDVHIIASRICGICSVAHQLASVQATEAAFGIVPSEQTILLRKLLYCGEMIESHILHLFFLAAPDFLHLSSLLPLVKARETVALCGLRLKRLGNSILEVIGGRAIHPQSVMVNGFGKLPGKKQLRDLQTKLKNAHADLEEAVIFFKNLKFPSFSRKTEFLCLKNANNYALISGDIISSATGISSIQEYLEIISEYVVPYSTAKFARHAGGSYAVGALARFNHNSQQLKPLAREAAGNLGLEVPCYNPFMNNLAQLVEVVHEIESSINYIDLLINSDFSEERLRINPRVGRGVGIVEAPRGLLIHDYTYDGMGRLVKVNCIIPTNQNCANIEDDLRSLVQENMNRGQQEVKQLCEMLVRAYDPCIGCSTH